MKKHKPSQLKNSQNRRNQNTRLQNSMHFLVLFMAKKWLNYKMLYLIDNVWENISMQLTNKRSICYTILCSHSRVHN